MTLNIICLAVVLVGSLADSFNRSLDIIVCTIIFISIIVQLVAILGERKRRS